MDVADREREPYGASRNDVGEASGDFHREWRTNKGEHVATERQGSNGSPDPGRRSAAGPAGNWLDSAS
jgi:hypothetical protein